MGKKLEESDIVNLTNENGEDVQLMRNYGVVNPLLASPSRRKTDKLDARLLAYQSMTGLWPESFIVNEEITQLRLLCRRREYHLRTATKISNQINNYILRFGHTIGAVGSVSKNMTNRALIEDMCSDNYTYYVDDNILSSYFVCPDGLPDVAKEIFPQMYEEYDLHIEKSKEFEKKALNYVKSLKWDTKKGLINGKDMLEFLCSVPGVGEITSLLWLTEVVTPFRFKSSKQISAYCGCDPSLKVSAGKVTSQTRRKGNAALHHAIIRSAGTCIQKHSEPFGQWGYNMYNRVSSWKRACGAVGRRIVVAMYHVHMNAEMFSYDKYRFYDTKVVEMPLKDMDISKRVKKLLLDANFTVSSDICDAYIKGELAKLKGFGSKAIAEIDIWINENRKGVVKNG